MKSYREGGQVSLGCLLLILSLAAAVLYPGSSAHAFDIQIGSSNTETINFAVYNTTPGSNGTPSFSSNGMLMSAGSQAFPVLGTVKGTAQSFSQTNKDAYTTILSANQDQLPSSFGTAASSTSASTALPKSGTSVTQQGVAFNSGTPAMPGTPATPGTFLQSASTLSGVASVSFASLHADFTNSTDFGATSFSGVPGVVISATGNLSSTAGSFVELANQGTITIKDNMGNLIATDPFTIIVGFTFNSTLTNNTYLYGTGTTSISRPVPTNTAFSIMDTNSFPSVTIPIGGTFSVDSNLTLVSDPGSLIELGDLSSAPGQFPDFGSFVGGPAPAVAVPEPSTLVQSGTVLFLVAGLWVWRSLGRNRRAARGLSRSRPGLAALVVLFFSLLAPGLAPAGTDHRK